MFDTDEYQILVVAEKYQTGFDQPKLYAMYVDKLLSGLNAVQTLSRLNRIHPDKDGTFILDFRNDAEEIRDAFQPYYGTTVAPPTDPNLLYDTRHALDEYGVLWPDEIETVVAAAADRRQRQTTAGSTPRSPRRSTGSRTSTRTSRRRFVDALAAVRAHLRVPVAGGVVHRRQAAPRLPVLQGARRVHPRSTGDDVAVDARIARSS